MPFLQHGRITMSGVFAGGTDPAAPIVEQWSMRLNLSDPEARPPGVPTITDARMDDITTDCRAWFVRPGTRIAQAVRMTQVKFALIGPDGRYQRDPVIRTFTQNGGAPAAEPLFPTSTACVVSFGTDRRGPRGRGRIYVPGFQGTLDSLFQWTPLVRDALETSTAQLIADLNNWPGADSIDPEVVVASSFGENNKITSVRVGRTPDVMRSRRTSIPEDYGLPTAVPGL